MLFLNSLVGSAREVIILDVMVCGVDLDLRSFVHVSAVTKKRATLERLGGLHSNEGQLASSCKLEE